MTDVPLWATILVAVITACGGSAVTWLLHRLDQRSLLAAAVRELMLCRLEDFRHEMVAARGIADDDLKTRAQRLYDIYHAMGGNGHGTALNDDIQRAPVAPREHRT